LILCLSLSNPYPPLGGYDPPELNSGCSNPACGRQAAELIALSQKTFS
jgi:hypothetical protein